MTVPMYILAAGDDFEEILNIIIVVAIVLVSVIGGLFQKLLRKYAEKQAASERLRQKRQQQPAEREVRPTQAPRGKEALTGPVSVTRPAVRQTARPPVQRPTRPAATTRRRRGGLTGVEEEMRQLRKRLGVLETERRRLTSHAPPEADAGTIEARLHVPPADVETGKAMFNLGSVLADPKKARSAIMFHEIFSPPKALRRGPEMWDM